MVLHKSKWDKKATNKYMKKHGIQKPEEPKPVKAKWSAKKSSNKPKALLHFDDDESEWDSEDEALLDHFYPQLGESDIPIESKLAIKRQIVNALMQHQLAQEENKEKEKEIAYNEQDGIYLGTKHEKPEEIPEEGELEIDEEAAKYLLPKDVLETTIAEYLSSDIRPQKNRKLLKSKMSENLLDEYGLDSYSSTVKDTDYSKASNKQKWKDLEKFSADELHGFRIGEQVELNKKVNIRLLTEEEKKQHVLRSQKLESAKLHEQIKKKFGTNESQTRKILEINNINESDERAMGVLNKKLAQSGPEFSNTLDDDLETLLGGSSAANSQKTAVDNADLDSLLEKLDESKILDETPKVRGQISKKDEDFLDELLG